MRIEFCSINMMLNIIDELQLRDIRFTCKVDDLGGGYIWLEHETIAKIAA